MSAIFECDQCDYKSTTKSALKLHRNSLHTMVKQTCLNCGSQFSSKSALRRHVESIHKGKKYPCDACGYLTRHKQSVYHTVITTTVI